MKWKGIECGRGEMCEMMLEEGLEVLVETRSPLPMKGRVMMWVNKSAMEQGVKREIAKRRSP